jgi:hypothetical protein
MWQNSESHCCLLLLITEIVLLTLVVLAEGQVQCPVVSYPQADSSKGAVCTPVLFAAAAGAAADCPATALSDQDHLQALKVL